MLRVLTLTALLLLGIPFAQAAPSLATVAVGPEGPAAEDEPYYVRLDATAPEAPHDAKPEHDCAADARPSGIEGVRAIANAILAWDPVSEFRVSGWFPSCVAASAAPPCGPMLPVCPGGGAPPLAYASYDTASGRYFVEARIPDGGSGIVLPLGPSFPHQAQRVAYSGTTGVGVMTDCEACPTPP